MAYFLRIVFLFFVFSSPVLAGFFAPQSGSSCNTRPASACRLTAAEAISDYAGSWPWPTTNPNDGQCAAFNLVSGGSFTGSGSSYSNSFTYQGNWSGAGIASGNHTLGTCSFSCPSGFVDNGAGSCVASSAPGCVKGQTVGACVPSSGPVALVCNNSCEALVISASNQFISAAGVPSTCGTYELTGSTCQPSQPVASPNTATQCPDGQVSGTFNGQTICLAAGTSTPLKQTTSTNQTTSSSSGTSTATTTSTYSCTGDGACSTSTSTSTVSVPSSGSPTTTTETQNKEQSQESFCVENPSAVICKEKTSSFGGGCGGFSCEGDAVQCAIAREQHQRNCALFDTQTPLSDLGNKVGSGVEDLSGAGLSSSAGREVVNLASSLDESKTLGGGCPADRTYSIWGGQTVTLPFSSLCPYLEFMGSIVLAFAYLAAARIVGVV